jgi:hypothetical protein
VGSGTRTQFIPNPVANKPPLYRGKPVLPRGKRKQPRGNVDLPRGKPVSPLRKLKQLRGKMILPCGNVGLPFLGILQLYYSGILKIKKKKCTILNVMHLPQHSVWRGAEGEAGEARFNRNTYYRGSYILT